MQRWILFFLLAAGLILAACSGRTETPTDTPTTATPTPLIFPSATPALPTAIPTETLSPNEALDGETTFAVITAVSGNMATIRLWLNQGLSVFERQAVVKPLAETSVQPLGEIFLRFMPHAALADSWDTAADLHARFYPALQSWIEGDLSDAAFGSALADLEPQRADLLDTAGEIARDQLGIDTDSYGPETTLANDVVFRLSPLIGQVTDPRISAASQEAPALEVRQLVPFVYDFAGTSIFTVIGLLENTGGAPLTGVTIQVSFFDEDDQLLGVTTGMLPASVALPGQQYPFNASAITRGEEKDLLKWTRYETRVLAQTVGTQTTQDFTFALTGTETDSLGELTLTGTLTNNSGRTIPVGEITLGVIAYDNAGNIVGVGPGSAAAVEPMQPGTSLNFEAEITALNGVPARYQFFAEAGLEE